MKHATLMFFHDPIFLNIREMYFYLGGNSLMYAADRGHTDIVKILIENEADVNLQANDGKFNNIL